MKNLILTLSLIFPWLLNAQSFSKIFPNFEYTQNVKSINLSDGNSKISYFTVELDKLDADYKLTTSNTCDSLVTLFVHQLTSSNDIGTKLEEHTIPMGTNSISFNSLPKKQKLLIKINYSNSLNGKLSFEINKTFDNFYCEEYNETNSFFNPVYLSLGDSSFYIDDNLKGIRSDKNGVFTKWFFINNEYPANYYSINLTSADSLDLNIYTYENNKLISIKQSNSVHTNSYPFFYLKQREYYLSVSSINSLSNSYNLNLESISNEICGSEELKPNINHTFENFNPLKPTICPGDTVIITIDIEDYLPFANNWIHSVVNIPNTDSEKIIGFQDLKPNYKEINSSLDYELNNQKFKGPGKYYQNSFTGPISATPYNSWGEKPNQNLNSFSYIGKIDEQFDCLGSDSLKFQFSIFTDIETGSYEGTICPLNNIELNIPIDCCNQNLTSQLNVCHGDSIEIKLNSKIAYSVKNMSDNIKIFKTSFNTFKGVFDSNTLQEENGLISFVSESTLCKNEISYSINKSEKLDVQIENVNNNWTNFRIDNNEKQNGIQWNLNGEIRERNIDNLSLNTPLSNDDKLSLIVIDENNCKEETTITRKLKQTNAKYNFFVDPNPTVKEFTLNIIEKDSDLTETKLFKFNIFTLDGTLVFSRNNLSVGAHSILTPLKAGSYYCHIHSGDVLVTKSLIIIN